MSSNANRTFSLNPRDWVTESRVINVQGYTDDRFDCTVTFSNIAVIEDGTSFNVETDWVLESPHENGDLHSSGRATFKNVSPESDGLIDYDHNTFSGIRGLVPGDSLSDILSDFFHELAGGD